MKFRVLESYYSHRSSDGTMDESDIASSTTIFYLADKYDVRKYKYKKIKEYKTTSKAPIYSLWHFILWYMDKNRPLPRDKEFDVYREKDKQRREKEGFLAPLIKSDIYKVENNS